MSNGTCTTYTSHRLLRLGSNPAPPVQEVIKQDISCNATGRIEVAIANPEWIMSLRLMVVSYLGKFPKCF